MKPYPKYKPTNIDWIGEIPEHWKASKIGMIGKFSKGKGITKEDIVDLGLPCIRNGEIYTTYARKTYSIKSRISLELSKELVSVEHGAVLFTGDGETVEDIGKCLVYVGEEKLYVGGGINIFVPDKSKANSEFLSYILNSDFVVYQKAREGKGEIVVHIYAKQLREILISIPPLSEQQAIVAFLDQKTALIDELIAKKERKIELLKEKRTALINHVVTKGLDPTVKYKDSGIDWIGEIPEHWKIVNFKHEIEILTDYTANGSFASLAENVEYLEEGFSRLVRLTDLRVNFENQGIFVSEEAHNFLKKSELFGGELLIANVGAYAGIVLIMPKTNQKMTLAPNMFMLRLKTNAQFYYYLLNSVGYTNHLSMLAISSAQPKLNKDNIKSLKVLKIPLTEQLALVQYLDIQTDLIDQNINLELQKIEKLKEYRQSLISNVVTGKIRVI